MKLRRLFFFVIAAFLMVPIFITWMKQDFNTGKKKNMTAQPHDKSSSLHAEIRQEDDVNYTFIEERNKLRIKKIEEICKVLKPAQRNNHQPHLNLMTDPNHHLTYCRVNKAASTYAISILSRTFDRSVEQLHSIAKELRQLPYTTMRKIISDSYTFTFVREPYGRLFSTYINKFYFPKNHWAPIGPNIVKRYREKPSKDSLKYGHNITFSELIRYTVEKFEGGTSFDEHLRPMNSRCFHCDYRFDFIGKLETVTSDWAYLDHVWSTKKNINIPKEPSEEFAAFHEMNHISKTFNIINDSTIPLFKLYLRAWSYFQITGLIYKNINMPFGENSTIDLDDFLRELKLASEKSRPYAEETSRQKREAMEQAYATVPLNLLERLSRVVALDCNLYGYDNKPDWIFNRTYKLSDFHYFRGLE